MNVSRRKFLVSFSASVATAFASAGAARAARAGGTSIGRAAGRHLSWNSLYPYIGTDFEFSHLEDRHQSLGLRLRLVSMSNSDAAAQSFEREPQAFVLRFEARADENFGVLGQDTYAVEHFALGRFDLFISQGTAAGGDTYAYTAVINRVIG